MQLGRCQKKGLLAACEISGFLIECKKSKVSKLYIPNGQVQFLKNNVIKGKFLINLSTKINAGSIFVWPNRHIYVILKFNQLWVLFSLQMD